jgi:glycosyltransferase involved in cell wall biosynthesis
LVTLAPHLAERRWDTAVVAYGDGPTRDHFEAIGVPVRVVPEPSVHASRRPIVFVRQLRAARSECGRQAHICDVVHAHVLGARLATLPGERLVLGLHNERLLPAADGRGPLVRAAHAALLRSTASRATAITAVSSAVAEAARTLRLPAQRTAVVPNGVDVDRFREPGDTDRVRRELGVDRTSTVVICVGRLASQKNVLGLLDAWSTVVRSRPSAELLVVGDGPLRAAVARRAATTPRVHLCGERSDVPHLLAASDVYVSASQYEGMSNGLLEAMAAGLPVVVTDTAGVRDVVRDGQHGFVVPRDEPDTLAAVLVAVIEDARHRAAMGAAGRRHVREHYTVGVAADRLAALYERVAIA